MRLKTLEIKGFKSFANETVIHFNADVIGIVGPNGSGKSNIVDAIRWVLGEQKSKELRLDQMTSVIFNGTKKRKAGGVAQVSMTFENTRNLLPTEYNTVTVSRMLYRTGESEYRLNGVPCRLKDITSLFLDTGIGSNSYAIIALGMVDDILADKEDARRKMFEQAAGVSKYKVRKRETLAKLKSATEDLDRVEDLLHEIDNNLKTLEKQAKRTKRYFELKDEYKQASTQLALIKVAELKERHKAINSQLQQEEDRYRQLEVDTRNLEAQLEAERKTNLDKEKVLSDRQRELNNLIGLIRNAENDLRMQEQRQQFVTQNKSKLAGDITNAQIRAQQLEQEIAQYREDLTAEKRVEARLELELNAAEEALNKIKESHSSLKSELDVIVGRQQQAERAVFELEKQKAVHFNQYDNLRQELEKIQLDTQMRRDEMSKLDAETKAIEAEERKVNGRLETLELQEENRQKDLQKAESLQEETQARLTRINRELDARRNEYKLTKSMIDNLEGFPESIRFLKSNKEWNKEAPLLSDLIYVNEQYRIAIENYLDPYLNYYVVENMEEAFQAIELLSRSQKGKANFFMLDAFRDYTMPAVLLPGAVQAIDMVETEPAYRNLIGYLLENVLVVEKDDLKTTLPSRDMVLLSKSGKFIQRRYSLSGGSVGLFEGKKIGRKKNLEHLEESIKKLERDENKTSTEFFQIKSHIETLKTQKAAAQIQQERNELNRLAREKVSLNTRLENFEHFISHADERRTQIDEAMTALQKAQSDLEKDMEQKLAELKDIKENIFNADGSYRQVAEEMSQASSGFNDKNIAFIRQQNKVSALQRELSFKEKQLEDTRANMLSAQQTLNQSDDELMQIQTAIDQLTASLQNRYDERKVMEASLTDAEQAYFQARGGITELEDNLRKINRQQQDQQILINQLKDKFNEVKFDISAVAQRLRIEFNIEINDIINQPPPAEVNVDELQQQVERVKNRLDNYGEINPLAVEAYDEMKERHDSISQQRDDIVKAKDSLMETIKEIEETATSQFLEAFEKARLYFIDVFRSLFTQDDNCDLILLEPDNPLESRIEIVAKPKGKRPQTISQLSGGEKTLTAIALLFALYLLKPAPFCIFDEVDAPLDDANINKFNKIIKKFSGESQFIIVTHNKLTMAAVDTIYGVFMAEQGVSGVSPVDFRSFEHSGAFEVSGR